MEGEMMDIEIRIDTKDGVEKRTLKNGVEMKVTELAMTMIYNTICHQMPVGHTIFRNYDKEKELWTVEVYKDAKDYKNRPIWEGRFWKAEAGI